MKALQGGVRVCFLAFFSSHIFASVLIDSQALLPPRLVPPALQDLLAWYAATLGDPLMSKPREILWFRSLVGCELLFQVPFFFVACRLLADARRSSYPEAFRYACIAYGAHTATTMVPILATLAAHRYATPRQWTMVLSVYLPYLLFPLWILFLATRRLTAEAASGTGAGHAKAR